jgi:hypothetical protein
MTTRVFPALYEVASSYPAIDNHAHPLLKAQHRAAFPFEGIISEAQDEALIDSVHTLACYRATAQLSSLYGLPPAKPGHDLTWDNVKAFRDKLDYQALCQTCFQPTHIQCILIDDGLAGAQELAEPYRWHDQLTRSPTKRIVRLETLAEVFVDNPLQTRHYS